MSLQYAILGFLSHKALTGYELRKAFEQSVQHFWPADQAQIYRTLNKMVAQNLTEFERQIQEGKPNKKIYQITETGRTVLLTWLKMPQLAPTHRNPFLVQLYFAGHLDQVEAMDLLERAIQEAQSTLLTYKAVWQYWSTDTPLLREQFFAFLTLEQAVRLQQTNLAWLKQTKQRLVNEQYDIDFATLFRGSEE